MKKGLGDLYFSGSQLRFYCNYFKIDLPESLYKELKRTTAYSQIPYVMRKKIGGIWHYRAWDPDNFEY